MAGGARLQSRVFVDPTHDRATEVARPQRLFYRTSISTSTIMPGVSGLGISTMSIFTGMRWVILVKLPDGLGVGSRAKRAVVALPMRATLPTKRSLG